MNPPFGPMVLIVNERAGGGKTGRALGEIRSRLSAREMDYALEVTRGRGHATELATAALKHGVRLLVAVGGDGTVHEVVNGMVHADRAVSEGAALGVVASGTRCDFIRTFGIPAMPGHAVAHLDGHESFPIDLGKVTFTKDGHESVRYFANVAEAGLGGVVARRAGRLPAWLGPTIYPLAFWSTLTRHRSTGVTVDLIDRSYQGPMGNLVVANGQFFGGGMKVAPKAAPTDGLLDIQVQHLAKREALAVFPKVYRGEHVPHPDILEAKRVRVSIEADRPLLIEADGEILGTTPARFEILKDIIHLKV